jgi:predicted HD phosphohydrolase
MPHHHPSSARLHAELAEIYDVRAQGRYGLSQVNQLMHAVQAGALARQFNHPPTLVVAALLHDLGHMVHALGEHPAAAGIDDRHEEVGARWLACYFGPDVVEPVRLHVAAKRYLCATEADYFGQLSDDSIESLALQGGPMTAEEIHRFETAPFWREAVSLRRLDEAAKDPNGPLPPFASFRDDIDLAFAMSPAQPPA